MYGRGLVVGKFYPPHRGHKYLIDAALSQCESVTVLVLSESNQSISGDLRSAWLKTIHPTADIRHIADTPIGEDDSAGWAKFTIDYLGYVPDAVFTSEEYGHAYALFMGTKHVLVDKDRLVVPISGTKVRSNPLRHFEFLEPCVRKYFVKRIAIVGAESTGTTTLAKDLAAHYKTVWAPEFGRMYSEGKLFADKNAAWRSEEFEIIARAQNDLEDALAESCNGLLICDTDAFATGIWHERYMGRRSPRVEQIAEAHVHDLYIVTGDEIPFEQDGTRDGEHIRHWMHERFLERLKEDHKPHIIVRGNREVRLQKAIEAIATRSMHATAS